MRRPCQHPRPLRTLSHSIHAKTILTFVFQEQTATRGPDHNDVRVPRAYGRQIIRSCSRSVWSPEHPRPNHNNVRVPRVPEHMVTRQTIIPFVFQEHTVTHSIHAQTIIAFVFHKHTVTHSIHAQIIMTLLFHKHTVTHSIHAQNIITFVFREPTVTKASMPKPS